MLRVFRAIMVVRDPTGLPNRGQPIDVVVAQTTWVIGIGAAKIASGSKRLSIDVFATDTAASISQRDTSDGYATHGEDGDEG